MIEVQQLTRAFGAFVAVDAISFSIPTGSICGFIGPNGAGKTTTLRLLATLDNPTQGHALIDGYRIDHEPDQVRHRVGYMPDYYGAYPDMIGAEYLDFFARAYRIRRSERMARIKGLVEFVELQSLLKKPVNGLSKGQKQRLSLARALLPNPPVLLMDEPAAGLDPRARIELRELLKVLAAQGKTVFISSHILTELSDLVDRVVIIDNAKIRYTGSLQDLNQEMAVGSQYCLEVTSEVTAAQRFLLEQAATVEIKRDADWLYWRVDENIETVDQLIAKISQAGIRFRQIYQQKQHLEKAFLQMTGKADE